MCCALLIVSALTQTSRQLKPHPSCSETASAGALSTFCRHKCLAITTWDRGTRCKGCSGVLSEGGRESARRQTRCHKRCWRHVFALVQLCFRFISFASGLYENKRYNSGANSDRSELEKAPHEQSDERLDENTRDAERRG